mgnify:CR=1 FL=1
MPRRTINPSTLSQPTGYSHVTTVSDGTLINVSGQIALDAAGKVVGVGDLAAQARQVYENLSACLKAAGASFADVIKLVTFVVNLTPDKAVAVRGVRREFLTEPYPASTMVGVTSLVNPDLLIEIEVVAFTPATGGARKPAAKVAKKAAKKAARPAATKNAKKAPAKRPAKKAR